MGPPSYMRSVVDRNVVMLRIAVHISVISLHYNRIILWDHRRICGPSLTETSLCCALLYIFPLNLILPICIKTCGENPNLVKIEQEHGAVCKKTPSAFHTADSDKYNWTIIKLRAPQTTQFCFTLATHIILTKFTATHIHTQFYSDMCCVTNTNTVFSYVRAESLTPYPGLTP